MSISEDCLREILARLPPGSLLRFKCVSKPWRVLIESPEFIRMHLNQSHQYSKKYPQFVFNVTVAGEDFNDDGNIEIWTMKTSENLDTDVGELNPPAPLPLKGNMKGHYGFVVGSCNGLICMKGMKNELILWNPWIKKSFILPRIRSNPCLYGFGYNDITDDYKIVSLCNLIFNSSVVVNVYSMKQNSWRRLPNLKYDDYPGIDTHNMVFSNGALHFIVHGSDRDISIAAIDLKTEEFRLLSVPKALKESIKQLQHFWLESWVEINVLDGCLFILPKLNYYYFAGISFWIMKHYGVENSWTKLNVGLPMNPNPFPPPGLGSMRIYPIGFSEGSMMLALENYGRELILYDIENQTLVKTAEVSSLECKKNIISRIPRGYQCAPSIVPVPCSL